MPRGEIRIPVVLKFRTSVNNEYLSFLPHHYQIRSGEKWFITIDAINIVLEKKNPCTSLLHIRLDELKTTRFNTLNKRFLRITKCIHQPDNKQTIFKEFERNSLHQLKTGTFNELTFSFTNEFEEKLSINPEESFLHCTLINMDSEEYHFTLTSEVKEGQTEIQTELPYRSRLESKGTWKLACQSVLLPKIQEKSKFTLYIYDEEKKIKNQFSYSQSSLSNPNDIISQMNDDLEREFGVKKIRFRIDQDGIMKVFCKTLFNFSISKALGLIFGNTQEDPEKMLSVRPNATGFFSSKYDPERKDPNSKNKLIFLKCDIVVPSVYDNGFKNVLKMIPFKQSETDPFFYESKMLNYVEISPSSLSSIYFSMEDEKNETIEFSKDGIFIINLCIKHFH